MRFHRTLRTKTELVRYEKFSIVTLRYGLVAATSVLQTAPQSTPQRDAARFYPSLATECGLRTMYRGFAAGVVFPTRPPQKKFETKHIRTLEYNCRK